MATASEALQKQIDDATANKNKFGDELIKLNNALINAKFGKKNEVKKAIKNVEQQIKQNNILIKKLNDDLAKTLRTETRQQDNVILAQQGKSVASDIASTVGKAIETVAPLVAGNQQQTRSADVPTETEKKPFLSGNMLYIVIGAGVLLLMLMIRKK